MVVDPYTYESAWLLDEAGRILTELHGRRRPRRLGRHRDAPDEAKQFLGPWADDLLTFADPDRAFVKGVGLEMLPAFVHVNMAGQAEAVAEGWNPLKWRKVAANLSAVLSWTVPVIPGPEGPAAATPVARAAADRSGRFRDGRPWSCRDVEGAVELGVGHQTFVRARSRGSTSRSCVDSFTISAAFS